MSRPQLLTLFLVGALVLALPACGGGGGGSGYRLQNNPILVTSTSIPPMMSGETFNYQVQISGGCGGPYVMRVIEGRLPAGLELDNETHSIVGTLLESGNFFFKLQIDDTGCNPFASTTATYQMSVGVGDVVVVEVLQDGNPGLIPPGGADYNPVYPALPKVVYNTFLSLDFVIAGGIGPYSMKLRDDPAIPNDGDLPLGVSIPTNSTSFVGAPVEVGPNGGPFVISLEVVDATGRTGYITVNWFIDTPPIIVATTDLNDGTAGSQYSDQFFTVEGVPPFEHEFVEVGLPADYTSDKNPNPSDPNADVLYNPGAPPTVNPPEALNKIDESVYPLEADLGPNYGLTDQGAPSEGIVLDEETGALGGIPRRRGTFSVNYHVKSTLVPNSFGQHAWATFSYEITPSGSFGQDPSYTIEGTFSPSAPFSRIQELEKGVPYNPDGGPDGLQLLAFGGVPQDGLTDAPHASQVATDNSETNGAYAWEMEWDPHGDGTQPIAHMEFLPSGVFKVEDGEENNLIRQGFQDMEFEARDFALPTPLASVESQIVRTAVGPDTVVITESDSSFSGGTSTSANSTGLNDTNLDVKIMLPFSSGAVTRSLSDSLDMAGQGLLQHGVPDSAGSTTELSDMLESTDLLRVSVNPGGWWNDSFNMNPKGAKGMQHGDANKAYSYRSAAYAYDYWSSYGYTSAYGSNPASTSVRLPDVTSTAVSHNPDAGLYTDGGKLYAFDSEDYFGVFIVRGDSKFYVPVAFAKNGAWKSFGDNWNYQHDTSTGSAGPALFKMPQMTVSPDGRFAAMKLSTQSNPLTYLYYGDYANNSAIVLFSLAGERVDAWGDKTYMVISTGANGSTSSISSTGEFLFAPSLTLTNSHLYYVCGKQGYSSSEYRSWRYNWFYRYEVESGDSGGALITAPNEPNWYNTPGNSGAMQAPLQRFYRTSYGYSGSTYAYSYADQTVYNDGYGVHEGSAAPMPFRVNAEGDYCVIIAGQTNQSSSSSNHWQRHVWIDDGTEPVQLSSTLRSMPYGASRGMKLGGGPNSSYTYHWGASTGPTSQAEISDDGMKVAVVVSRNTSTMSYTARSYNWFQAREDVIAFVPSNGTDWSAGADEIQVTGSESTSSKVFADPIHWRFGSLMFTKEGDGLIFWGGASGYYPTSSSTSYYAESYSYVGSFYAYAFEGDDEGEVIHILPNSDGGISDSAGTTYPGDKTSVNPSYSDGSFATNRNIGAVKPVGGFFDPDRNFAYVATMGGLSTSYTEAIRIIAINIRSLDDSQAINGHDDGRAFALGGSDWPSRRNFVPHYSSYWGYYGIRYQYYSPGGQYGSMQVMAKNGFVFFGAHWNLYGPTGPGTSGFYGGPVSSSYYGDNGIFAGQVAFFDSKVAGPVQVLSTLDETLVANNYNSTTRRAMKYLEPRDDGSAVAFVYAPNTGSYWSYPMNIGQERVGIVQSIVTNPLTGEVISNLEANDIEGSSGRVSSSVTHDTSGSKMFYGFGSGDEANKQVFVVEVTGSGTSKAALTSSTDTKRFNALHSGR